MTPELVLCFVEQQENQESSDHKCRKINRDTDALRRGCSTAVPICLFAASSASVWTVALASRFYTFPYVHNYANLQSVSLRTVRFYRKANGECPVEVFLEGLPAESAAKVVAVLKLVEQQPTLSDRFLRKLKGTELFEVRVLVSK